MGCGASANAKRPASVDPAPSQAGRSARGSIISRRAPFEYTLITDDVKPQIAEIFRKLDADGNGTLEKEELHGFITCYDGRSFDQGHFDTFFATLDTDGNGSVDEDEFCRYIAEQACMYADDTSLESARKSVAQVLQDFREILSVYYNMKDLAARPEAAS